MSTISAAVIEVATGIFPIVVANLRSNSNTSVARLAIASYYFARFFRVVFTQKRSHLNQISMALVLQSNCDIPVSKLHRLPRRPDLFLICPSLIEP